MKQFKISSLAFLFALTLFAAPCGAEKKAHLGFSTSVAVNGVFSPTIGKIMVTGVTKNSPAEAAGLKSGDEIIEVNGRKAVGAPARELGATIQDTKPGEHLRFKVKRSDGSTADVDIIAG